MVELQQHNQDSLQAALKSIMEAMGLKEDPPSDKYYTVKAGDTLGEIALKHHTTVKKLKEWNHLANDQIVIGKKLRVGQ